MSATPNGGSFGSDSADISANVVSTGDGRWDNDYASSAFPVTAPVDLSVTGPGTAVSVVVGATAHVPFTVHNVGASAAAGPTAADGTVDDGLPISAVGGTG